MRQNKVDRGMMKVFRIVIFLAFLAIPLVSAAQPSPDLQKVSNILVREGNTALTDGDLPLALKLYEQAVVSNPQNIAAYIGLGQLYLNAELLADSLKYFDIALSLDPANIGTLELQSYAYLSQDDIDLARSNLAKMEQICFDRECEEISRLSQAIESYNLEENKK